MRLRQGPMIEASALMGISFILFMIGLWVIKGDLTKAMGNAPILAALLIFPAFVLWAVFGQVTRDARPSTRFLVAIAVTIAIAAGGAFLMQPGAEFSADQQQQAITEITRIVIAFAIAGLSASALTYGWLLRPTNKPDPTLLTKPVVQQRKKKRK